MSTTDQLLNAVTPSAGTASVPTTQQPRTVTILDTIRSKGFQNQMMMALPKSLTAERLTRIVMTEFKRTPALYKCSPETVYGAVMQCAALGLEPGSALGHCYLLPFGSGKDQQGRSNCQLIIGYRGMIDLARRSGQIVSLNAYCVHQKDEFKYTLGLDPNIIHVPSDEADRGPVTHVYAVAKLVGGGVQFEVMSRPEIEKIRSQSKAGTKGPWVSHWDEMAKKTVIRRLFKYLPVSIEAVRAVEVDEKSDRGEAVTQQDWIDTEFVDKGIEVEPVAATPAE